MNQIAADFLTRCFAPGETIALLLRTENPPAVTQRIVTLEQALAPRYLGWLAHENHARREHLCRRQSASPRQPEAHQGVHRFRPPSIYRYRHGRRCPARCAPGIGCGASADRDPLDFAGQVSGLWRVDGFDFEQQEQTLKLLAIAFGGDPACTDCNRVLRIPGFLNRKYDPAHRVTVEYPGDSSLDSRRLPAGCIARSMPCSSHRGHSRRQPLAKHSTFRERLGMGLPSACPRQRRREADAGAGFAPLRQAQSSLLRAAHRRRRFGPSLASRRHAASTT